MFFGRGKNKLQEVYNITDMYPEYVKWVEGREKYTLRGPDFTKIIDDWNKGVVEALYEGKEFCMPAGLGRFRIIKSQNPRPTRSISQIDWKASAEVGKVVYFRNTHSDGYSYRLFWQRGDHNNVLHQKKYFFMPCRSFKRKLAQIIKDRKTDYYQK